MSRAPSLRELRHALPENVVILPTAQARQVQQKLSRAYGKATRELRQAQGREFPNKPPYVREAERRAAVIAATLDCPAVRLARAILGELDLDTRKRVIARLEGQTYTPA